MLMPERRGGRTRCQGVWCPPRGDLPDFQSVSCTLELHLTPSWSSFHDNIEGCLDRTLKSLGTDYLDLYLVHWPMYVSRPVQE